MGSTTELNASRGWHEDFVKFWLPDTLPGMADANSFPGRYTVGRVRFPDGPALGASPEAGPPAGVGWVPVVDMYHE